jgi:hypothetical protein
MTEPSNRLRPSRGPAALSELKLLVRPPGNPAGIQAFTVAERADAELYAAEVGAKVETLG